jgi:hypothetical protein
MGRTMRQLPLCTAAFAILALCDFGAAIAQGRACATDTSAQDPDLRTGDPGVVSGGGVLTRGHDQYAFSTFSAGNWDPMMPGRACLRYEIFNNGNLIAHQQTQDGMDDTIYSFRWHDIGFVEFKNISYHEHCRFYSGKPTNYDSLTEAPSVVNAFENANATTRALLPIEVAEKKSPGENEKTNQIRKTYKLTGELSPAKGFLQPYSVAEHFPSIGDILSAAHIPSSPVWAVPTELALQGPLRPSPDYLQIGEASLRVRTSSRYSEGRYVLETDIDVGAPVSSEPQLFAPGLEQVTSIEEPIDANAIVKFIHRLQERQLNPKKLDDGRFQSVIYLPISKDLSVPSYYLVDYPVTMRTKNASACVTASVFSAYPINLGESFCKRP